MHPSLHHGNGNVAGLANHKLSGMTNRGRTRKCRDVGIGNADGVCKIVGKRSQAGAKNEPNLRADLGLRKDKCRGGFGPSVQVWIHEIFRRDAACRVSAEDTCVDSRYCPRISGSPFLPLPITTTLAFGLLARSSAASIRLRSASCFSFCRRKLIANDSCSACCFDSMEALSVAGSWISRSNTLSTIKPRWPRRLASWSKICLATISRSPV